MFNSKKREDQLCKTYYNTGYEQGKYDFAKQVKGNLDQFISSFENTYTVSGLEIAKHVIEQCLNGDETNGC